MSKEEIPKKVLKIFNDIEKYLGALSMKPPRLVLMPKRYDTLLDYYNLRRQPGEKLDSVPDYKGIPIFKLGEEEKRPE